MRTKETI